MSQRVPKDLTTKTSSSSRKPVFSFAIATACGLGYLPVAPGTFGSLAGVALTAFYWYRTGLLPNMPFGHFSGDFYFPVSSTWLAVATIVTIALFGIEAATRVEKYLGAKDPQIVVIDEVSGQLIAYIGIGAAQPSWKYLLLGFILFRVFDILKLPPARQAESLPSGLGIMADDWIAGAQAALVLWIARRALGF